MKVTGKAIWTWYSSARPADCQRLGWMTGGRQLCVCPRAPPITRRVPVKGRMTAGKINQPTHHKLSSPLYLFFGSRKVSELCEGWFSAYSWHAHTVNNWISKHVHFSRCRTEKTKQKKKKTTPSTSNTSYNHKRIPHLPTSIQPFPPSQPPHRLIRVLSTLSTLPPLSDLLLLLPPSLSLHSLAVLQQLVLLSLSYFFAPHLFFILVHGSVVETTLVRPSFVKSIMSSIAAHAHCDGTSAPLISGVGGGQQLEEGLQSHPVPRRQQKLVDSHPG